MSSVPEYEWHAYADGLLDPARTRELETWLADHPEARAQIQEWQNQNAQIRAQFADILSEPIPDHLHPRAPWRMRLGRSAMLAVAVCLGVVAGWMLHAHRMDELGRLATYAAEAHQVFAVESRHPVEVDGRNLAHLTGWLSKRLGHPLRVPHLQDQGFRLIGGRLLPHRGRPAAQFMYQDGAGQRLTLMVTVLDVPVEIETMRHSVRSGVSSYSWADDGMGCVVSASLSETPLREIAQLAYDRMEEPS